MTPYSEDKNTILKNLNADENVGLSGVYAREKLAKFGKNKLEKKKKKSFAQKFFEQFKDAMIIILIIAAAVSFGIALYEKNPGEFFEPVLILLIVVLNAVIGVLQENKAERALEALQGMSALYAKVIRDGHETVINAEDLVPGDIIKLEAGDFVPADARLLTSASLKCEEAALTGESLPFEKEADITVRADAPLGDRVNMIFSGCSVTYGTATAVVTATGMNTEMGKIANLLNSEKSESTPLQKKLAVLGKYLGFLAIGACAVIFIVGAINKLELKELFMTSVSLAVSAIPEGLPAIVTVILSIGVQRMVKKNAIIRRLPAVETLGSAAVICSDKTGTLTQNKMTVTAVYTDGQDLEEPNGDSSGEAKSLLLLAALCCNGTVTYSDGKEEHIGDPTETSIVAAAHKVGYDREKINAEYPRMAEIPFDSDRKLMTTINKIDGKYIAVVKGAFDVIADRCVKGNIEKAKKLTESMSGDALRVLAVACKEYESMPEDITYESVEKDLTFLGLVGMIDPPRNEAIDAVAVCKKAGIRPVMITGDHIITASAIAGQIGIKQDNDLAITGAELDKMTDEQLDEKIEKIAVYARVSPENKIRIVKAWQKRGKIVAMTGDGVNDAPALKAADIGCAMGITGTDVAKGAADMTLTDDNFATIVDAVREGRGIYDNIRKVVGFLLGTNIGEVITVFAAMLLWHKTPLLSMQLLWINLVTDSLPAIALGTEAVEEDVMTKKPRNKNESIFANHLGLRVVLQGVLFAILTLVGFVTAENVMGTEEAGRTLAFIVLALSQIMQVYNMRSDKSLFKIGVFTNKTLNKACIISVILVLFVVFTPLRVAFGLVMLDWYFYPIALVLVCIPTIITEGVKAFNTIK